MRIAQLAPLAERVPPKKYGGTERVVYALTEELVRRGHEVTLFASGDSITSAKLESVYPRGLREARLRDLYGANTWTLLNIGTVYDRQNEFDIIHDHLVPLTLPTAHIATTPVVGTMHMHFTSENRKLFQTLKKPWIVTISESQMYPVPNLTHAGTVYNGLPMENYPFSADHDDYLLYVGRFSIEKGVHFAAQTALELDQRLIIAAKLEKSSESYFREYIEPYLSDRIQWVGEVDEEERNKLMSRAKCFLHPVIWREPFGLTLIEAMACGCPVIAFNRGSIPEIVRNGVTGYVVQDTVAMVDAVDNIHTIDRAACREHALSNFNASRMADGYENVYQRILSGELSHT